MRFYAVVLYTKNFNEMVKFYKDKLGLEVRMADMENEFIEFRLSEENILAIVNDDAVKEMCGLEALNVTEKSQILHGIVSSDIETDIKSLKDKGVTFLHDIKTTSWGQNVAYFRDPDGNLWEIGDDPELS